MGRPQPNTLQLKLGMKFDGPFPLRWAVGGRELHERTWGAMEVYRGGGRSGRSGEESDLLRGSLRLGVYLLLRRRVYSAVCVGVGVRCAKYNVQLPERACAIAMAAAAVPLWGS